MLGCAGRLFSQYSGRHLRKTFESSDDSALASALAAAAWASVTFICSSSSSVLVRSRLVGRSLFVGRLIEIELPMPGMRISTVCAQLAAATNDPAAASSSLAGQRMRAHLSHQVLQISQLHNPGCRTSSCTSDAPRYVELRSSRRGRRYGGQTKYRVI
jgi:hypothetical protein